MRLMSSHKKNSNSRSVPLERKERLRNFTESPSVQFFCIEFDPSIDLDLPEDEQIDLIFDNGHISDANEAWARMVGLSSARELLGVKLKDLTPRSIPENLHAARQVVRSRYTTEDLKTIEWYESEEKRVVLNNIVGVIEKGHVLRLWGTARDITDMKSMDEKLQETESDNRSILEVLKVTARISQEKDGERQQQSKEDVAVLGRVKTLTPREYEIMTYVIAGLKNREIARFLGIAEGTVKIHRRNFMAKMKAASVAELVRNCERVGVLPEKEEK